MTLEVWCVSRMNQGAGNKGDAPREVHAPGGHVGAQQDCRFCVLEVVGGFASRGLALPAVDFVDRGEAWNVGEGLGGEGNVAGGREEDHAF